MSHTQSTRRAFTLVELLVVVSIIALLLGILLPALGKAREQARAVRCLSLVKQMVTASKAYNASHKGWNVPYYNKSIAPIEDSTGTKDTRGWWDNNPTYRDYLGVQRTYEGNNRLGHWPIGFICPNATVAIQQSVVSNMGTLDYSYGFNGIWTYESHNGKNGYYDHWLDFPDYVGPNAMAAVNENSNPRPSESISFVDSLDRYLPGGPEQYANPGTKKYYKGEFVRHGPTYRNVVAFRHPGFSASMGFWDGHASTEQRDKTTSTDLYNAVNEIWKSYIKEVD